MGNILPDLVYQLMAPKRMDQPFRCFSPWFCKTAWVCPNQSWAPRFWGSLGSTRKALIPPATIPTCKLKPMLPMRTLALALSPPSSTPHQISPHCRLSSSAPCLL